MSWNYSYTTFTTDYHTEEEFLTALSMKEA
jgi:hypothetical protein